MFYQWYQWYTNIIQGPTNGTAKGTIGSPNSTICFIGKPMVPLVKLSMVSLGEPQTKPKV